MRVLSTLVSCSRREQELYMKVDKPEFAREFFQLSCIIVDENKSYT